MSQDPHKTVAMKKPLDTGFLKKNNPSPAPPHHKPQPLPPRFIPAVTPLRRRQVHLKNISCMTPWSAGSW